MSKRDKGHYIYMIIVVALIWFAFDHFNAQEGERQQLQINEAVMEEFKKEIEQGKIASHVQVEIILRIMGEFIAKSETACFVLCDRDQNVTFTNRLARRQLNLEIGEQICKSIPMKYHERHDAEMEASFLRLDSGKTSLTDIMGEVITKDGSLKKARVQAFPYSGGAGAFITILDGEILEE